MKSIWNLQVHYLFVVFEAFNSKIFLNQKLFQILVEKILINHLN